MVHVNLLLNNFNIVFNSDQHQFRNLHMGKYRNCCLCFRPHLNLCSCMDCLCFISCHVQKHLILSCIIFGLCIMPCLCLCVYRVVCFFPVVLLLDSSAFDAIVRIRSTTLARLLHGLDLLPSGIPGKMIMTLDISTIFTC